MRIFACLTLLMLGPVGHAGAASFCSIDFCLSSTQSIGPTPGVYFMCPAGDTGSLSDQGWSLSVQLLEIFGFEPAVGVSASWVELRGCPQSSQLTLCGTVIADEDSDASGMVHFADGVLIGGGCSDRIAVFIFCDLPDVLDHRQLAEDPGCARACLDMMVRSPDIDGSGWVNLVDLSTFSASYPPRPYESCCDMDANGVVNLVDLSTFSQHFGPPGHVCP